MASAVINAGTDDSVVSEDRLNETELTELEGHQESPPKNYLCVEEEKIMDHSHSDGFHAIDEHALHAATPNHHDESKAALRKHQWHKHSHHSHGPCHSGSDLKDTGIANIAWMVIMGDGIHNFSDGLAIGESGSWGPGAAGEEVLHRVILPLTNGHLERVNSRASRMPALLSFRHLAF